MAEYDRTTAAIGTVHVSVAIGGEGKVVAAELERLRVAGLIDRITVEVIVPRARLDPTPEAKRLPPIRGGDAGPAFAELDTLRHRLSEEHVTTVAELLRRFAALTETE